MKTQILSALIIALWPLAICAQEDAAKLMIELENSIPRKAPSPTGQPQTTGAPDWDKAAERIGGILARASGTMVEPHALFHLGNCLYNADKIAEARALFEDLKGRFAEHPFCAVSLEEDGRSFVDQAIADCLNELAFRQANDVKVLPKPELDSAGAATIHLTAGKVKIRFYKNAAKEHRQNFIKLAREGFYDLSRVHRIVAGQLVHMGDPNSKSPNLAEWGKGGPNHSLDNEFSLVSHRKGTVTMFRGPGKPKSHGSQFQILLQDQPHLDYVQTPFAEVVEGIELLDELSRKTRNQYEAPVEDCFLQGITFDN